MPTAPLPDSRRILPAASGALLLLLLLQSAVPAPAAAPTPAAPSAAIDALLKASFPADRPGAAVIVTKGGETLFRKAYGMADLELGVPLQPDMVFRLGSITKQFTAAAILMLAEEGKLSPQDPIEKHLPGYPTQGHTITIEHLLTHTSGIQSYTDMPGWMTSRILSPMTVTELIDGFKKEPMQFAPGERWAYNNSGYILLGAIVEKASGKTYEAFVQERIFQRLGMTASYYDSTEAIIPRRAPGYRREGDQPRNARYLSMTQPYAAGSLASTVDDLARWDASLYTETLLKKASLEGAWTPYVLKGGKATGYGYGWGVSKLRGRRAISHGGGIFGFSTYAVRLPDEHVYVAVLCNSDSPPADPGYLGKKIAALVVGDPFPEPVAITLEPKALERYAGVYRIDESSTRTVTVENGRIYTQRTGGQRLEIRPDAQAEFFYEKSLTRLRFVLDASGRSAEMLLFPEGADEPERALRVADAPAERTVAKVDSAVYDAYVGEYEIAPGFILTVTREGDRLMTQATGQQKVEVFPSSETEFFLKVVDAQITFVRGPSGTVDQLVLHQGGRDMPAKKRK
jgi:CubicO group peptidase (beta-lactamase class C family)